VRFFVTGIGGFAGLHLAEVLLGAGHEVYGLVTGRRDRHGLVALAQRHPSFAPAALASADVTDREALERAFRAVRPDGVFHLAGLAFVPDAAAEADRAFAVNTIGTIRVLEAARAAVPACRVLAVTSSFAYGSMPPAALPITEDAPLRPLTIYGISKAAADMAAHREWSANGLAVVRARTFNHTGPGQSSDFVCSDFARQLARIVAGAAPPVLRTGNLDVVRDFSDVRDVARGYVTLWEHGSPGEAYNLCSGVGTSVRSVLDTLVALAGVQVEVIEEETRKRAEVPAIVGSAARAHALGWRPAIPLRQTLADLLGDWQARLAVGAEA
jgi:GDP-4-dehydro-6-deoxy-D-mannose reductase